jgi:hypothetical protein
MNHQIWWAGLAVCLRRRIEISENTSEIEMRLYNKLGAVMQQAVNDGADQAAIYRLADLLRPVENESLKEIAVLVLKGSIPKDIYDLPPWGDGAEVDIEQDERTRGRFDV